MRCTVCSHPDSPAVNHALALPACRAVVHGLTAARKWGLSLIFRQENRACPPFLGYFLFQVFGGSTARERLLSPLPHAVPPPFREAEAKHKRNCTASAPLLHRCTSEALAVHWRNQAKLTEIYAKRSGIPPDCRVVYFVCVVCVVLVVPVVPDRLEPYGGDHPTPGKTVPTSMSV